MLSCTGKEKIYVVCGAEYKTGGTELLHQLVYSLNNKGLNAFITYINIKKDSNPINKEFEKYVKEYKTINDIVDDSNSIIILPEIQVKLIDKFKHAKMIVWWLSVDNYLKVYNPKYALKLVGTKGVIWYIKNAHWRYRVSRIANKINYNLAQSYYAIDFLNKNNFKNVNYLSDYISDIYLEQGKSIKKQKEDIILYNPKKGIEFTKKLMQASKDLKWIPIINMNNEQVLDILQKSKVYVDFGNHPGKDRFPREAAYCGCCILTGKLGSANFYEDVPIDEQYKFEIEDSNIPNIIKKIRDCLNNFEQIQQDFDIYRSMIENEKKKFNRDIDKVFFE